VAQTEGGRKKRTTGNKQGQNRGKARGGEMFRKINRGGGSAGNKNQAWVDQPEAKLEGTHA